LGRPDGDGHGNDDDDDDDDDEAGVDDLSSVFSLGHDDGDDDDEEAGASPNPKPLLQGDANEKEAGVSPYHYPLLRLSSAELPLEALRDYRTVPSGIMYVYWDIENCCGSKHGSLKAHARAIKRNLVAGALMREDDELRVVVALNLFKKRLDRSGGVQGGGPTPAPNHDVLAAFCFQAWDAAVEVLCAPPTFNGADASLAARARSDMASLQSIGFDFSKVRGFTFITNDNFAILEIEGLRGVFETMTPETVLPADIDLTIAARQGLRRPALISFTNNGRGAVSRIVDAACSWGEIKLDVIACATPLPLPAQRPFHAPKALKAPKAPKRVKAWRFKARLAQPAPDAPAASTLTDAEEQWLAEEHWLAKTFDVLAQRGQTRLVDLAARVPRPAGVRVDLTLRALLAAEPRVRVDGEGDAAHARIFGAAEPPPAPADDQATDNHADGVAFLSFAADELRGAGNVAMPLSVLAALWHDDAAGAARPAFTQAECVRLLRGAAFTLNCTGAEPTVRVKPCWEGAACQNAARCRFWHETVAALAAADGEVSPAEVWLDSVAAALKETRLIPIADQWRDIDAIDSITPRPSECAEIDVPLLLRRDSRFVVKLGRFRLRAESRLHLWKAPRIPGPPCP
jgi:hypothetical protein